MSKVRDLKKDMKQMCRQFLNECYTQLAFSPSVNQEYILDIIADMLDFERDSLRQLSSCRAAADYRALAGRFYDGIVELAERLHSLDY